LPPPNPPCTMVPIYVRISNENGVPLSSAKVNITSVETGFSLASSSFVSYTTVDGKVNRALSKNGDYQITVTKDGYEAKTEGIKTPCIGSDCSACAKLITLTLIGEKAGNPVCPGDMNGEVKVVDEFTKEPISGAVVNVVENQNITVVKNATTNLKGTVTVPLSTNGNYSISITKDGYDSIVEEHAEENCTLSVVAELSKPDCHTDNVTITFNVHVRENVTDEGVKGASVDIFAIGQSTPLNRETLITDLNGKVSLNISDAGTYKVAVSAEGMYSYQSDTIVICDKTKCENCSPVAIVEMNEKEAEVSPPCKETKLAVETLDIVTRSGVNAQVTITFIPEHNDTVTDEDVKKIIVADHSQCGSNGNLSIPIEGNGKYIVDATADGYLENSKTVTVNCSTDNCSACSPKVTIPLTEDVCNEIDFKVEVTDATTSTAIADAFVTVKIKTRNGYELVSSSIMKTDVNGIIVLSMLEEDEYHISVEKDGYDSYNGAKTIACGNTCPCAPELSVAMNQEFCNQTITADITVQDAANTTISNATVVMKLSSSVAGASSTNVGGKLVTNINGTVSPPVPASGTYEISVDAEGFLAKSVPLTVTISSTRGCEDLNIPLIITLDKQEEEFCPNVTTIITIKDKLTNMAIPLASVDITLGEKNFVTGYLEVAKGALTDINGQIEVPISKAGNYDILVSKDGYLASNGTATVQCDLQDCGSCSSKATLAVDQPRCPDVVFPVTITDRDTGSPVIGAKIKIILTSSLSGPSLQAVDVPKYTNVNGTAAFNIEMNGNYSISIEADGYDSKTILLPVDCNPVHCKGCAPMAKTSLEKEFCKDKTRKLIVRDSLSNNITVGALVKVTKEVLEYGPIDVAELTVGISGEVDVPLDGNGVYHTEIKLDGYETLKNSFLVNITSKECPLLESIELQPLSPELPCDNGIRISLTWGQNPKDLDMYSSQVNKNDTNDQCLTYYCDGKDECPGATYDVDNKQGGLNGAETITFCDNEDYVQTVYVDDLSGQGASLLSSNAKIVITSKTENKIVHLDSAYANKPARYWLAGCLTMKNGDFDWIEVNQFMDTKPDIKEPLHCYNRAALKESINNPKYESKILVKAISTKNNHFLSDGLAQVTINQKSFTSSISTGFVAAFEVTQKGLYTVDISSNGYIPVKSSVIMDSSNNKEVVVNMIPNNAANSINLLLEWPKTENLDLHVLKVSKTNSLLTCMTYFNNKEGCKDISLNQDKYKGGSNGGEMITVSNVESNRDNTFMVFAHDNSIGFGGPSLETSNAQLTVTDGEKIQVEAVPKATLAGAEYWLIGCMQIVGSSFNFVKVGTYTRQSPLKLEEKLTCHDLFKNYIPPEPKQFCKNTNLQVIVHNSITNSYIAKATVSIKQKGSILSKLVIDGASTNSNGILEVPVNKNGEYIISVEAAGYISKMESKTISCDHSKCEDCRPSVLLSLSPVMEPKQYRLTLTWAQMDIDLDMFVVQRNINGSSNSCKTFHDHSCNGVAMDKFNTAGSDNSETVTFSDIQQNDNMVSMVYVQRPCGSDHEPKVFIASEPQITITDGKVSTQLGLDKATFKNEKYWLAACIKTSGSTYQFISVNDFLEEQPDIEVPDYCLSKFGYHDQAPAAKPWSILKPSAWFR